MRAKPKVAVLMAACNGMLYIEEQLSSILSQVGVEVSIFMSVDHSTDGTLEWARAKSRELAAVSVLPEAMPFGGAAKNFFHLIREVDLSAFDYIAFADQDDIWALDKLKRACDTLESGSFDGYSSNVTAFWPDGTQKLIVKSQPQKRWDYLFEAAGPGCTYVLCRPLMQALKNCLLKNWDRASLITLHDWFCYAFARANRFTWFIDKEPRMLYRQHAHNQVGVNRGLKAYYCRFQKIKSGWWLSQAYLIASIIGAADTVFVKSWSQLTRKQILQLGFKARQCRRRSLEGVVFFMACLYLAARKMHDPQQCL